MRRPINKKPKRKMKPIARKGTIQSNGTSQRLERSADLMKVRGTTPNLTTMGWHFDLAAKKGGIRQLLLERAARRALWSMVDSYGFLNRKTNQGIRRIMQDLYKKRKISFGGETSVDFRNAEAKLGLLIGKRGARQFMRYFEQYLEDETNYYRSHRRMLSGKVILEEIWATGSPKKTHGGQKSLPLSAKRKSSG